MTSLYDVVLASGGEADALRAVLANAEHVLLQLGDLVVIVQSVVRPQLVLGEPARRLGFKQRYSESPDE